MRLQSCHANLPLIAYLICGSYVYENMNVNRKRISSPMRNALLLMNTRYGNVKDGVIHLWKIVDINEKTYYYIGYKIRVFITRQLLYTCKKIYSQIL